MNPKPQSKNDDDMLPDYDFSNAVRGKYYERYRQGTNVVLLDPDVAEVFSNATAVNEALRALVAVADAKASRPRAGAGRPNPYQPSPRQQRRSSPSGRRIKKTRDRKR